MRRPAPHLARLLACAAAPVMLIAGCSSGSDDSAPEKEPSASASASASPTLAAAKYTKLPDPCGAISQKTVKSLVPEAKDTSGTPGGSGDSDARGGCSWHGLDGYQYRWLDVAFQRYDPVPGIGSAEDQAKKQYEAKVGEASGVKGAEAAATDGLGDEATTVVATVKRDKEEYREVTVVARTANVVVTLSFDGAGYEDATTPKAEDMRKKAVTAAGEAVGSVG